MQKVPSSVKCNKHNFLTGLKNRKQKQKKQDTPKKKEKILHNLDRTPEEILKVRIQKFLGCRGYLREAKSLCKRPLEVSSSKEMQGL